MIGDEFILDDPVFRKRTEGLSAERQQAVIHQDPYHRYRRILGEMERHGIALEKRHVLDLGCLRPELASLLVRAYGSRVTAVDRWNMLDTWRGLAPAMNYLCVDLESAWEDRIENAGHVDVVFALEVIEHMIDPVAFLARISNVLKPGGHLVVSTPNINSLRNRLMVPLGIYPSGMEYRNHIHHVRMFNVSALHELLLEKSLSPLATFGISFLPYRGPMHNRCYRKVSEVMGTLLPRLSPSFACLAQYRPV